MWEQMKIAVVCFHVMNELLLLYKVTGVYIWSKHEPDGPTRFTGQSNWCFFLQKT